MNLFKNKIQDERVVNEQNKIYREIYLLIYIICLASVICKFFVYGYFEMEHVATEMIIFLVAGIYYGVRASQKGLFSAEVELHDNKSKWSYQTKTLTSGIVIGVLLGLFFGLNSAYSYADSQSQAIYYFFITFVASMMFYIPILVLVLAISYSSAKKQSDKAVEKQLEDEE
ncbi:hypothetical protein SAMN04487943_102226 [Gracilibacillus orientalis]|uniref:Uncharacterized protein n=1 Tax=Gracilibacillus orientalis TaxID=334253 RepID=A0A1I4IQA3_9BACI|nr:DUF6773 family protein [Gracilibacillus orientalis]SFL56247.1 hypothetical protein SAMN04487943_102226 [Gracilibacillus orientalis]